MAGSTQILSLQEPSISIRQMDHADSETLNEGSKQNELKTQQGKDALFRRSKMIGDFAPFVMIGDFKFEYAEIERMTLEESGFVPEVNCVIRDTRGVVSGPHFPKNKPILSLYVRSRNDNLKCIRNDFLITSMNPVGHSEHPGAKADGVDVLYRVTGFLNAPMLYSIASVSYKNSTSFDVLKKVAAESELGYASNMSTTKDNMTWVNPYWERHDFVKYMTARAYAGEESYLMAFVDKFYHLNYLDISGMLTETFDFEKAFTAINEYNDYLRNEKDSNDDEFQGTLLLSNLNTMRGSDLYISSFDQYSEFGDIWMTGGQKGVISYYDPYIDQSDLNENFINYTTSVNESVVVDDDSLANRKIWFWTGVDHNNGHENYMYSRMNQLYNSLEFSKLNLRVVTDGVTLSIIRGMRIPVVIFRQAGDAEHSYTPYTNEDDEVDAEKIKTEEEAGATVNRFLSGYYWVKSVKYHYDIGRAESGERTMFYTELELSRGVWPNSPDIQNPNR